MPKASYCNQLHINELIENCWYVGRGLRGNIALWNGKEFALICDKLGRDVVKYEGYYDGDLGTFQPFAKISEGTVIEPLGARGLGLTHYANTLDIS